jgi:glycosyltransferase involved in cell wall biosynthesis
MKIALVAEALNVGGMESYLYAFAKQAEADGYHVTVVVTGAVGEWHRHFIDSGINVETVLPNRLFSRQCHCRRVAKLLSRFDALILNHCADAQSSIGLLPDDKVAVTVLHNDDEPIYTVGLSNVHDLDMVVAVSDGVRSAAISRGAPEERIVCIRNGVVIPPITTRSFRPNGEMKVVFVGRINHQQKGVLYLPGIVSKLSQSGCNFSLDIVGDGGEEYGLLRQQLAQAEKEGIVRFHGALPPRETMSVLEGAHALVMPSHYEGQGIVMLEAMARGVVPVVSRLDGVTDTVVTDGVDGFLVPVGDETAFAQSIASLCDTDLLNSMSRAAYKSARERFSIETMTRSYMQLISDCLDIRRSGGAHLRKRELEVGMLGKRSQFPLVLHDFSHLCKSLLSGTHKRG